MNRRLSDKKKIIEHYKRENGFLDDEELPVKNKKSKKKIEEPLNPKFEEAKKYSIYDGMSYSVMQGSGEYFISPFIIKLGATNFQIGLLSSLSSLLASISHLFSTEISDYLGSRKKVILPSVLLQAIIWIPLIFNALIWKSVNLTLLLFSIYAISGSMASAPYSSWLGDIVKKDIGQYFGLRSKLVRLVSFTTTLIAGFILNKFAGINSLIGFSVLFLISFVARFISYNFIKKMYEPPIKIKREHYFTFIQFVKKMRYSNFGIFVLYLFFLQMSVSIASPYFTPFLLRYLKLDYKTFVFIDITTAVAMFLTLEAWGKLSDKIGNKKIMNFNAYFISLYPILWLISWNHVYLMTINFISGVAWAGFALSSSNYVYDAVTAEKRTRCIAYSNFFKGIAVFIGAMFGAFVGQKFSMINTLLKIPLNKYLLVFLLSGIARLTASLYFLGKIEDLNDKTKNSTISAVRFFVNSLGEGVVPSAVITRIKNLRRRKRK